MPLFLQFLLECTSNYHKYECHFLDLLVFNDGKKVLPRDDDASKHRDRFHVWLRPSDVTQLPFIQSRREHSRNAFRFQL